MSLMSPNLIQLLGATLVGIGLSLALIRYVESKWDF